MLDLTFLATGHRQHVFVRTSPNSDDWVYKIPAAPGYLVPYRHKVGKAPRRLLSKKGVRWILFDAPYRLGRAFEPRASLSTPRPLRWLAAPLRVASRIGATVRNRVFLAYFRRARAMNFTTMLDVLERLTRAGLRDHLVPFQIIRQGSATLRIDDRTVSYDGPMLMQHRVETFFTKQSLATFEWDELVDALHALWRHGFALTEKGENLGYRSWALIDGHLRLADTSSLSTDFRLARNCLRDDFLAAQQNMVVSFHGESEMATAFREFFDYLRQHVNQARLDALWRIDVDRPAVASGGASVMERSPTTRRA